MTMKEQQENIQLAPITDCFEELKDKVSCLTEKNSKEHGKFSKEIDTLNKKLDEIIEAQKREKRKEDVKEFIKKSSLEFEIQAGVFYDGSDSWARLWIKIPNEDKTDFNYIPIVDIPVFQNYFDVKIFYGKTYNPPDFSPRGSVLIDLTYIGKADGNGFVPMNLKRFWFDIDKQKITPAEDFDGMGDCFTLLETITGRNLYKIYKKIKKYTAHPTDKNLCLKKKVCLYDFNKRDFYQWEDREKM